MGLLTEYPLWFILLCPLLGAIYTFFLYYHTFRPGVPVWANRLMSVFRFLSVSLIAFLLLSPMIRTVRELVEKPIIIIGQDNTASLILGADSALIRKDYPVSLEALVNSLQPEFDVRTFSVGEQVSTPLSLDFSGQKTDLAAFFREIRDRFENRNVGAVILASDGIHNVGPDPLYATETFPFPVYTIALGDTTEKMDIRISRIIANQQVHLGDHFPVEIQINAYGCAGTSQRLNVSYGSQEYSRFLTVSGNRFSRIFPVVLKAGNPGWNKISVTIDGIPGEASRENNSRQLFVEVLDQQTRVVMVYDAPHPDIAAIASALTVNRKYLIEEQSVTEFLASEDTTSVHLFYQVPAVNGPSVPDSRIRKLTSAWFILGSQTNIQAWNQLNTGVTLNFSRLSFADAYPLVNESFPFFSLDPSTLRFFSDLPPLQSPFAAYHSLVAMEVLIYQKINGTTTRFPLLCFHSGSGNKRGYCFGENIWRWRMINFAGQGDHLAFDELIQKTVHYLSVISDKSFLRIYGPEKVTVFDRVEFEAELFNKNYEPVSNHDISFTLEDDQGNSYPFVFIPAGNRYTLNAGMFAPGEYRYKASATLGNDAYAKSGLLLVEPSGLESVSLKADHQLLYRLAARHQGKMVYPDSLELLAGELTGSGDIHAIAYTQKRFTDLVSSPLLLALILALLMAEWFLRKYYNL